MRLSDAKPGQRGTVEWDGHRLRGSVAAPWGVEVVGHVAFNIASGLPTTWIPGVSEFAPEGIPTEDGAVIRILHTVYSRVGGSWFRAGHERPRFDSEVQGAADNVGGFEELVPRGEQR